MVMVGKSRPVSHKAQDTPGIPQADHLVVHRLDLQVAHLEGPLVLRLMDSQAARPVELKEGRLAARPEQILLAQGLPAEVNHKVIQVLGTLSPPPSTTLQLHLLVLILGFKVLQVAQVVASVDRLAHQVALETLLLVTALLRLSSIRRWAMLQSLLIPPMPSSADNLFRFLKPVARQTR